MPTRSLPFRLEEQTKRLQKDMKKSTDADLGKRPRPVSVEAGAAEDALFPQTLRASSENTTH